MPRPPPGATPDHCGHLRRARADCRPCHLGADCRPCHLRGLTGGNVEKYILDACCGGRQFWYDKQNAGTIYMDARKLSATLCDGRRLIIAPDIVADFRNMPFPANNFNLIVFDPPHLINVGRKSWLFAKYGALTPLWAHDLKKGMEECFRVLKPCGTLVFKWSENHIKLTELLKAIAPCRPIFGNKTGGRAVWLVFTKPPKE